jgi:eukaryotic-like serine/threonine-protein kinase
MDSLSVEGKGMPSRLDQFVADVVRSGLVPADAIAPHLAEPSRETGEDPAQLLADRLTAAGLLTNYQARKLLTGATRGFLLGDYRILDQLGQGGSSKVFLAAHKTVPGQFAIKVLPPRTASEQQHLLRRFQREMELSRRIDHSNVARTIDVGVAQGACFIVMQYIDGANLYDIVKKKPGTPLSPRQAAVLFIQAAEGLKAVHKAGLVHRDVKPSNIIVTPAGEPIILDLGLSIAPADTKNPEDAEPEGLIGTADYISPEQADAPGSADQRSDLYSLGCTLYFALAGRPPFKGGDALNKIYKHHLEAPIPIEKLAKNVPEDLAAIVRKLMAKDRDQRHQSMIALQRDLKRFLTSQIADSAAKSDKSGTQKKV